VTGRAVFLSYSSNDLTAAKGLREHLARRGLSVFFDKTELQAGDRWLDRLQAAVDGCGAFVVLVGRDGVARWVGAETQAALNRHFGARGDADRLPIFPVLLDGIGADALPAFLRLFQATAWDGASPPDEPLLSAIRDRTLLRTEASPLEGSPFVGLAAFRTDQAHLFFGRQQETLAALSCFDTRPGHTSIRWLEINGTSGSGKSSLLQAGLLPLIGQGWLWPRTGIAHWRRIGPMLPGARPVEMLAESVARAFDEARMADLLDELMRGEDQLRFWLRERKADDTAFLLAIDQFEELFTFAEAEERRRFDRLLAAALADPDCPLFVLSTVRADFLDRFADDMPELTRVLNHAGKRWTLAPIGDAGLREVIDGPARLAGLDVDEVREAMLAEARGEAGALPLVENALDWLWQRRENRRLSGRLYTEQGGLAGLLSRSADDLLDGLEPQRSWALELLFRLVKVDPEGVRHARQRIGRDEAVAIACGGETGLAVVNRLSGQRRPDDGRQAGPLRLITVGDNGAVNLIHETLIRSKGLDSAGSPQPYWPTLWTYIEQHKERAARRERLQLMAREWQDRRGFAQIFGLAGWSSLFRFRGLAAAGSLEQRYLRWSRTRAAVAAVALAAMLAVISESVVWAVNRGAPFAMVGERWAYRLGLARPPFPELVEIPAGFFQMGSDKSNFSKPVHRVTFAQALSIAATEITFREWDACVADGGCDHRPADQGWGRDARPVINVSWQDAQVYTRWLSRRMGKVCRLPSEAEWEYAARAGTATEYALPAPNGSDDIKGKNLANCADCGSEWDGKQTAPVGRFPANAWGLLDMHGNVFKWVEDCWHSSYQGAPDDGRAWRDQGGGDCSARVLRGGSWLDHQVGTRSASRGRNAPFDRSNFIGFRVVCVAHL
jgi:formylglycine-generating enzyme required for sulfatase activity